MSFKDSKNTHFGFRAVSQKEKAHLVAEVFHSVAPKYDLMNDLMSLGLHRLWKRYAFFHAGIRKGNKILDVAAGTGDLTQQYAKAVGKEGLVVMTDINESMLSKGRDRLIDQGILENTIYVQANAEFLPFANHTFDCVSIAFGLRNVTDKSAALSSMYRVLKPGGKVLILEFSKPMLPLLDQIYDLYSFHVIPLLGEWVTGDKASYQYLVESIRMHPDQENLKALMIKSGFEDIEYFNLTGGIVALHKGMKY